MFDSLARLADRRAAPRRPDRDRLLPPCRSARRLGRLAPRPLWRRRPGDRDRQGEGTAAGRGSARPVGAGGRPRRPGRLAGDAPAPRRARTGAAPARRRAVGQRLLHDRLARLRLPRRPLDLPRGRVEVDRRQAVPGSRGRHRRPARRPSRHPGRRRGGRPGAGQQAGRGRPAQGRADRAPTPLLPLAVVFRGLVAALVPPLVGVVTIAGALVGLRLLSSATTLRLRPEPRTGMGLGLAIDYSLFVVSRYREELARVGPGVEALRRTLATAGRTVLFSSRTVAAALASLLVFPQAFLRSMGLGGVSSRRSARPSACSCSRPRSRSSARGSTRSRPHAGAGPRRPPAPPAGLLAQARARRHAPAAADRGRQRRSCSRSGRRSSASASRRSIRPSCRRARALPASTWSDGSLPPRSPCLGLGEGRPRAPAHTCVPSPRGCARCRGRRGRAAAARRRVDRDRRATPSRRLAGERAARAVVRAPLRALPVLVGGSAARLVDQKAALARRLPYALAIVVCVTLLVLFLMTGSAILPLKCDHEPALDQRGLRRARAHLPGRPAGGAPRLQQHGRARRTQPVLIAVAFGLSTDYGVFLLARSRRRATPAPPTATRRDRARADRPDHHRGSAPLPRRDRRLRRVADPLDQGDRRRRRPGRAHRRDHRPRPARPRADAPPRPLELVGAGAAAAPAPAPGIGESSLPETAK